MKMDGYIVTFLLIVFCGQYLCQTTLQICITNCVQCKQMFGRYFQGRACGDACLTTNGKIVPDCNNPGTLGIFLKRLY